MTTYVMQARENYTPDLISQFPTLYAALTTQMYAGISYDRVRRKIIYCANTALIGTQIGAPVSGTIVGGAGYTDGFYPATAMTGGSGSGATSDITVLSGAITVVTPNGTGAGYLVGDVLSARPSGGFGASFTYTLTAVSAGAVNNTGFALWTGQTLIAAGAHYDGTIYKNHSIMEKSIDTDAVVRYDAWSSSQVVPSGKGGGGPLTGTISNAGSSYPNASFTNVETITGGGVNPGLFGGVAALINPTFGGGGTLTSFTFSMTGHYYSFGAVITFDNIYTNRQGSGASITVSTAGPSSDGTWRRAVESNATTLTGVSTLNTPRIVDPTTGNVWAHHLAGPGNTCQIYLLRRPQNFVQEISPLGPVPAVGALTSGGKHMQPLGITATYFYCLNQQNFTGPSFLVLRPRDIDPNDTAADYLLPFAWYTWPYPDWLASAVSPNITGATNANPCVVTFNATGAGTFINGNHIRIQSVGGMTQLNGNTYQIHGLSGNTFQVYDISGNPVDSTAFGAYTSGGTVRQLVWTSRHCFDLSNNFYAISYGWDKSGGGTSRQYKLLKFAEPTSVGIYNSATVGGGITDITPWATTTGPNTSLGANTYNSYPGSNNAYISNSIIGYLPASNNLWIMTKVWGSDLNDGTLNSTTWGQTRIDVTYVNLTASTFDYHGSFLTGYLLINTSTGAIANSTLASGNYALQQIIEVDTDIAYHSYDFSSTGFDYTIRWFFLALFPISGGTYTPPATADDPTNRTLLIQVQFVPGSAPTILQTIWDTGWNSAYAAFGTAIGNANVVTATAENSLLSNQFFTVDSGIYAGNNVWWWSGQSNTAAMFPLNSAFSGRSTGAPNSTTGLSQPFLRLSLSPTVPGSGAKVYTRYGQTPGDGAFKNP